MRETYSRHYQLQAAFTGSDTRTRQMVEPCRIVMDMVTAGKHGHQQDLEVSRRKTIDCAFTFLGSQVNGAAFMLQGITGNIIVSTEKARNPSVMEARSKLNSVVTHRGWHADVTGFSSSSESGSLEIQRGSKLFPEAHEELVSQERKTTVRMTGPHIEAITKTINQMHVQPIE